MKNFEVFVKFEIIKGFDYCVMILRRHNLTQISKILIEIQF